MNLRRLLILTVVLLAAANLGWRYFANRGLVTLDADKQPLSEVIRSLEKQAHITLRTNLDPATPITLHVKKVRFPSALDSLAAVADARWRLNYFLAPQKSAIDTALAGFQAGQRDETWKRFRFNMPFGDIADDNLGDPRRDPWPVKKSDTATLQASLENAAREVEASFSTPADWNPPLAFVPKGELRSAVPKLAKKAGGTASEIFLLSKNERREEGPPDGERQQNAGQNNNRPRREGGWRGGEPSPEMAARMEQRMHAEIAKLPPEKQAAAKAEFDQRRAFFQSLRGLPPEERRAKMEEHMSDPAVQSQMEERMAARDAKSTPEQRTKRYQRYVQRKLSKQGAGQ